VPCASLDPRAAAALPVPTLISAFVPTALATNRCTALAGQGLLSSTTTAAQATEAMNVLLTAGYQPESIGLLPVMYVTGGMNAIGPTYANAYGQFSVTDNLCGYSVAAIGTDGKPTPVVAAAMATIFPNSSGLPGNVTAAPAAAAAGTAPNFINNLDPSGPKADMLSTSASTGLADGNFDGALCLRNLQTGTTANAVRVQGGNEAVKRSGNLRGKPAVIVHGLSDTLVPNVFSTFPYLAANKKAEGSASNLSLIVVTNANHYDILSELGLGFDTVLVPLDLYFFRAMDAVWARIKNGTVLPPSQFVRTTPRGGAPNAAPALQLSNMPAISASPASADTITFANSTLTIPQ
jgi:hydroxybutyrate-dimer hydrolase